MKIRDYWEDAKIDLRDLCFALFSRWQWVLAAVLCLGVLGGVYGYDRSVVPVPVSLEKDSDLKANIEKLYDQQNLLETYEANEKQSVIARLDSLQVSSFDKSYIVTVENNELSLLTRVLIYYSNLLQNEERQEQIAAFLPDEYRAPAESVSEILQVKYTLLGESQLLYGGSVAGQIDITILGPDRDFCEGVMHILDQTIAENAERVSEDICMHTITSDGERYRTFSSDDIRKKQEEFVGKKENVMAVIATVKKSLTAEQLSYVEDIVSYMQQGMTMEAADQAYAEKWEAAHGPHVSPKYIVLGMLFGAALVCICIATSYIMADRLRIASECADTWDMAVMGKFFLQKNEKKGLAGFLNRLRYGKEFLDDEDATTVSLLQARVQLSAEKQGFRRIYITGSHKQELIDRVYQMLQSRKLEDVVFIAGQGGLDTAEELQSISGADAVLLVEQLGKTKHENLRQIKNFLCEQQKEILGVVVYR